MSASSVGYFSLLRNNRNFRTLWYSQVASQLGDWLDIVALLTILQKLTGSGGALGGLIVAQFLPSTFVGLFAGVLLDRLPRKIVMIAADLGSAAIVLLFLLVRTPEHIWIIYVVTVLKMTLTSFYEPARDASVPNLAKPEELVTANALSGVTWSVILAGGAALGGGITAVLGTDAAFILDSLSFLVSALLTWTIPIAEPHRQHARSVSALEDWRDGFRYLAGHPTVALYASTKALWGLGGGVLVLLTLFGQKVFVIGEDGALGVGLLFGARGVGAALGPWLARHLGGDGVPYLRRTLGPGFIIMGVGYLLFSGAPTFLCAFLALVFAHCGGSAQWVFSTTLLQLTVPNRLQGRVFALEMALLTLTISLSSFVTGLLADEDYSLRMLSVWLALSFLPPGILLTFLLWRAPSPDPLPVNFPQDPVSPE